MDPKEAARIGDLQRRLKEVAGLVHYIKLLKKIGMRPGWNHLLLSPRVYRDETPV